MKKIILGSSSKFRREVMEHMGYDFICMSPDIDEKAIRRENPVDLVLAIAQAKAEALKKQVSEPAILITSDQVVTYHDKIREKPQSRQEAKAFLKSYSNDSLQTVTSIVVTDIESSRQYDGVDRVTVHLSDIPDSIIDQLLEKGEVMYCAGAVMIEDPLLETYIKEIEGDMSSVMGLPETMTKDGIENFL